MGVRHYAMKGWMALTPEVIKVDKICSTPHKSEVPLIDSSAINQCYRIR